MKDVVVHVAGVGGRDHLRRRLRGRIDREDPRVIKIRCDDHELTGQIDDVRDIVRGLVVLGGHDVPWEVPRGSGRRAAADCRSRGGSNAVKARAAHGRCPAGLPLSGESGA